MGFLGAAAVGAGGAYLQKRAQDNATKQQNALINQQSQQNMMMAQSFMGAAAQEKQNYMRGISGITASAAKAKRELKKQLPFPTRAATDLRTVKYLNDYGGTPNLGRAALIGM